MTDVTMTPSQARPVVLPPAGMRVPPHNLQAEESLLGAMMLRSEAIGTAVQSVSAADFYKPAHGHIYEAVCALWAGGEPVDPVTVSEELKRAGLLDAIGGPAVLLTIQSRTPAVSNAAHYAKIIEDNALLRKLIATGGEIAELGYTPRNDIAATVDAAETMVYDIGQHRFRDWMQ